MVRYGSHSLCLCLFALVIWLVHHRQYPFNKYVFCYFCFIVRRHRRRRTQSVTALLTLNVWGKSRAYSHPSLPPPTKCQVSSQTQPSGIWNESVLSILWPWRSDQTPRSVGSIFDLHPTTG
eukprot:GILK01017683.1.p2 GENE.GILK01017683.1~~GILK01017683.1.p2  ORF type:complete len:121 (+),score=2.37 GILK01017683.1:30-392(+)